MRTRRIKEDITACVLAVTLVLSAICPDTTIQAEEKDVIEKSQAGDIEWNIGQIKADNSYNESKNYKKIKVALLDSGVDTDEDIDCAARVNFLESAEEEDTNFMMDDVSGHGTSIAGIICAKPNEDRCLGLAANVELYSLKVYDSDNTAPVSRIVKAIEWAIKEKVNIIHMSFGTKEYSPELRQSVKKAYGQGILLVAAAGNDGTAGEDESTVEYPAAFEEVLSVGATDTDNKKAPWSSTGRELDLVAPGDKILSDGAFGGIVVQEGTSLAAAQVTGIAAVLWGQYPTESNAFIKELIQNSANATVNQNGNENERGKCGNGMLDYEQAKTNYRTMKKTYEKLTERGESESSAARTAAKEIGGRNEALPSKENINYVNGLWSASKHQSMVQNGNKKKILKTSKDIALVKSAAVLPDSLSKMKAMSSHPCFHGGGNYIANSEYLYYLSQHYGKDGKMPTYKTVFSENSELYTGLEKKQSVQDEIKAAKKELFQKCKEKAKIKGKLNLRQKRLIFLGVALHNATDAFSHRAYKYFLYNTQKANGTDKKGNPIFKKYSEYMWAEIVHPKKSIKSKTAKKKAVPVVWEKLRQKNAKKKDKDKQQDQETRIIAYDSIIRNLAIADEVSKKEKVVMPKQLQKYAQDVATGMIANWKSDKTAHAYDEYEKIAQKAETYKVYSNYADKKEVAKKKTLKIGLACFNRYWKEATGEEKKWKINQTPTTVTLPDQAENVTFSGTGKKKKVKNIQFTGDGASLYDSYELTKKGHRWLTVKKKDDKKTNKIKVIITSKKKLTSGSVVVVGYNGLRYKTAMLYWQKKITYTKKGLKDSKKIKGKNFTVKKDFTKKAISIEKTSKFKKNKKNCKGYAKSKKGALVKSIRFGKGTPVTLYPQFK